MRTPTNESVSTDIAELGEVRVSEPVSARPHHKGGKAEPERKCILTGEVSPRAGLIRLAVSPDGLVLPDVQAKAPGRGAWIGVTRAELEQATEDGRLRGALSRAFKTGALEISPELPHMIEAALVRTVLDRLGLELRGGNIVLGSQRIADSARKGEVVLVCHASDASADGMSKLDQAWRVGHDKEGSGARGLRLPLDRAALSVALGRENVVHFGVFGRHGRTTAANRVSSALERLMSFQGDVHSSDEASRDTANPRDDAGEPHDKI